MPPETGSALRGEPIVLDFRAPPPLTAAGAGEVMPPPVVAGRVMPPLPLGIPRDMPPLPAGAPVDLAPPPSLRPVPVGPPVRLGVAPAHPLPAGGATAPYLLRAGAFVVDAVIVGFLTLVLGSAITAALLPFAQGDTTGGIVVAVLILTLLPYTVAGIIASVAYALPLLSRGGERNGQTLGKQLAGLRVVRLDATPLTLSTAAVREVLWKFLIMGFLGAVTALVATVVDHLWPLWDARGQTLHDKGARTRVVRAG
jgi:uncharacterized RDD family membrane protein YckC